MDKAAPALEKGDWGRRGSGVGRVVSARGSIKKRRAYPGVHDGKSWLIWIFIMEVGI